MPVGYNNAKNPWSINLLKISEYSKLPRWVEEFYQQYNCTERLIIN